MMLAAGAGVVLILGLPKLLKWSDSREVAAIAERREAVQRGAERIAPLIGAITNLQGQLKNHQDAERVTQRILTQYDQLKQGIEVFESFTEKLNEHDRVAAAEHIMKELQLAANNTVQLIDTPQGRGLVIRTGANTFRVTFPVPMRIVPDILFPQLPPGVTANVIEKSNIGFTVVFVPQTIPVQTIPPFSASAEL
jgi:hypothetical protein